MSINYKGVEFERETHARWAVFFDTLNIRWSYKRKSLELSALGHCLPEFEVNLDSVQQSSFLQNVFGAMSSVPKGKDMLFVKIVGNVNLSLNIFQFCMQSEFVPVRYPNYNNVGDVGTHFKAISLGVSVVNYGTAIRKASNFRFESLQPRKLRLKNKRVQSYVYRFLDSEGCVIYVGRTVDLKLRMSQHFSDRGHLPRECYNSVARIEFITCKTYLDMKIKELYYIGKCQPQFNIADKSEVTVILDETTDVWESYKSIQ